MLNNLLQLMLQGASVLGGTLIVLGTLYSILQTYVLPRGNPDFIAGQVFLYTRRFLNIFLLRVDTYKDRDQIMALFAPIALIILPIVWITLITIGYAFILWGVGVDSIKESIVISGSSLLTLGFATADDLFRILIEFSAATIGLLLIALLIAYLPTMYAAFAKRETAVTIWEVYANSPPSAWEALVRLHRIKGLDQTQDIWDNWRIWFAELEESHTSFAALVFFRSHRPDNSWITAAGSVLDAAAIYASCMDIERSPKAELCLRSGYLALRYIADFFGIEYDPKPKSTDPISITEDEFCEVYDYMQEAGLPLKSDRKQCWQDYAGWRVNYDKVLLALSALTMAPYAPWVSDRSIITPDHLRAFVHGWR